MGAAGDVDVPAVVRDTPETFAGKLKYGWDGDPGRAWLASVDGVPVGLLTVEAPTYDNTNLAWFEVEVHPEYRGRGIGSQLMEFGFAEARRLGRKSWGFAQWDLPKADAFAKKLGFEAKSVEVNRRQEFKNVDWAAVERLYDEAVAAAKDYELITLVGDLPEEMLDDMVTLTASINDAPTDDLEIEDDVYSPERLRGFEIAQKARGRRLYRVIARHRETGVLAGHSTVGVEKQRPHIGMQADTAVARDHRGHRLGVLVKIGMIRWLREAAPTVEQVDTWNAESNAHMIAVNDQIGYRVVARAIDYQRPADL
ncbi:GNAT family N-acetyltransferase [Kribbella deserti]|uniref:GNAT family N-acetyltransferase n=1 Tax=Kribbella deserti TaxID=1926257 RepID=A0ABV6QG49_9ACTN